MMISFFDMFDICLGSVGEVGAHVREICGQVLGTCLGGLWLVGGIWQGGYGQGAC